MYKIFILFFNNVGVLILKLNKNTAYRDLMEKIVNFIEVKNPYSGECC